MPFDFLCRRRAGVVSLFVVFSGESAVLLFSMYHGCRLVCTRVAFSPALAGFEDSLGLAVAVLEVVDFAIWLEMPSPWCCFAIFDLFIFHANC